MSTAATSGSLIAGFRGGRFASFTIFNKARATRGVLTTGGGAARGNERGGMF